MDFSYSELHNDIKSLASDMLGDFSDVERLKKLEANGPYLDHELWQKMIEAGITAAAFPEALGGMGMDYNATTLVAEVIGRTMVSTPYIPCIISSAMPLLALQNRSEVARLLAQIASGEKLITAALIEPGNEDPLRASSLVDQRSKISGYKHCVPFANDADYLFIAATKNHKPCVAVLKRKQPGVKLTAQLSTAHEPQYRVDLNNADIEILISDEDAHQLINTAVAMTTVAYCAMAVGAADKMTRISGEYTSQRKQFGVAIATFQAVAHRLADCYIDTQCLNIITLKAGSDINNGIYDSEAIAMAKVWCGNVMHRVSQAAQHVHGGAGIDRDYYLFRYCLWAKQLELAMGNSKQHISKLADRLEARYLSPR
ncbi:MAG: acyl-CoA/acyl-ACP dehydrogenase [Pseudomonadales bacterium]|nr:acyl-CoA/acyl-ACP dehydrogenase [Pseudomonadales bacterium]